MSERGQRKIEMLATAELIPYEKNARTHSEEQIEKICRSIQEFGFVNPVLIDEKKMIIAGHGRVMAAKKLGMENVPCLRITGLTDTQIRAYILADNKLAEDAGWDDELLKVELEELTNLDFDITIAGFEIEEVIEPPEVIEDTVPEQVEPKSKPGDIWILGNHRLMCGDSTDVNAIDALLDNASIKMIYTDPPYGMQLDTDYSGMVNRLDFAQGENIKNGRKYEQGKVDEFHPEMVQSVLAIKSDEAFLWGANYYAELLPNRNDGSWIVWDKRSTDLTTEEQAESSDKMYGSCFELCWSRKAHKQDIARVKWAGVFGMEQEFDHKRYHPTQKPVKLSEWFITRYTSEGDTVVDLFGGSGSTLIACEQTGRKCFMMELDPHYCDVIIQRWENLTGQKAELTEVQDGK